MRIIETQLSLENQFERLVKKHFPRLVMISYASGSGLKFRTNFPFFSFKRNYEMFTVYRANGEKYLFRGGVWMDIEIHVSDARAFDLAVSLAREYLGMTGKVADIVKKF